MAESINWGSIADWASAVGSVAASITALYLARSADRIHLRGSFGLRVILGGNAPQVEVVSARVTNMGRRSTIISTLAIRTGLWKKRLAIVPVWDPGISHPIPKPLNDGEDALWCIQLENNDSWLRELCSDPAFLRNRWDISTFRLEVHTSNGGKLVLRPEKSLRHRLLKALASSRMGG